ncbi:MAG TPA: XdhC/CoxI family protein [Agriterribacter sp.]|nr:XdhC/CoxI family protein [Agriterribacter sp.]
MKELNDIILAYDKAVLLNKQIALATVVKVEGSSYRRPGARMLVTEDGEITGAISGGCLEGDALRKAQFAMFQQKNKLEIYDTTDDEDNRLGVQLGCNGIVYILFEPVNKDEVNNPVNLLKKVALKRKNAMLATIFDHRRFAEQEGTCGFVNEDEVLLTNDNPGIKTEMQTFLKQKISAVKTYDDRSILYQFVPPAIQLVIVGAGNDAQPLVEMSSLLGWNSIVVDGRPAYATQERFPTATKISLTKPADILAAVHIDEQTAVVLMTHNYNYDLAALEQLMNINCNYIGVLGPKKKLYKMLDELQEKNGMINKGSIQHIHGPVGLDIGAETSEEIALSIIAEVKAVFSNRNGASLKERKVDIHERSTTARPD